MTTKEVADRLVHLCKSGQWDLAISELYAQDIHSTEMPGGPLPTHTKGLAAMKAKGEQWQQMIESFHGAEIEGPVVADPYFSCSMISDVTLKGGMRTTNSEICLYRVKDGKIISEQFFY
ncbi:MAG: ester cyclase [Saprospiraceae bacterium]|nr:ester cyclase [Saprospiraceae bacterium]